MRVSSTFLGHLGLVAGCFDELGISSVIDGRLPKNRVHKLDNGVVLKAMLLNGLGFVERKMYLFPEYYGDLPVERLFGVGVQAGDFSDDVLGRFLDRVYEYGATRLFNDIVLDVMKRVSFGTRLLHVDTTSFSVYGEYESSSGRMFEITIGHPKDGRWDLNRFVLAMVSNQYGVPLFVKAYSGNESDKNSIIETVEYVRDNLCFDERVYHVADSAFYSLENLGRVGKHTFWITHVPATLQEARELLGMEVEMAPCSDARYSFYETRSSYGGVEQKWVLVQSRDMQARMEKTYEKNLSKEMKEALASLKHLCNMEFYCEKDALQAADKWIRGYPRYQFKTLDIVAVQKRSEGKRGRPRNGEELRTYYKIEAGIGVNEKAVASEREKLGRFLLASNDLELGAEKMLEYYKGQGSVERGFRFLKDKSFRVAEVYLKKPERIEALAMIMVLTLFVYSYAEWKLREKLVKEKETVLSQLKKPTSNPTMKWVFFKFKGITQVEVEIDGTVHVQVANMNDELRKILRFMGPAYEKYYQ